MSLDSLFHHILLTEQQAKDQRRLLHEVKSETVSCQKKIRDVSESLKEEKTALEAKVCLLSEKRFQRILLTKRHKVLETQKGDLQKEKQEHLSQVEQIKKDIADEQERFMKDVLRFNDEYGLTSNRDILIREQAQTESQQLKAEKETLINEIESLKGENVRMSMLQLHRDSMKKELVGYQLSLKDLEEKISDAIATTKHFETEKFGISQKPQSDTECLRLKKELELYKEEGLENVHEALRAEIEYLQMELSQKVVNGK
ncbi:coiled-coil domain-containing protein 172 [Pelobates fuscus]|uniref:coiled-coil domain-containing protein 172 n=1 Tax=Pelobates fuscus TaxID=191477 RepID=UPI002FE45636